MTHPGVDRTRTEPRPGDPYYLHLSDILLSLRSFAASKSLRVLDFGAGVSPYRSLFPGAAYLRADIEDDAGIDFVVSPDGTLPEAPVDFDLVLSTQVAEHVPNPKVYFGECYRLLKPGGQLLVTTHGMFEEHGYPSDFQRWTAKGMTRDLEEAGFTIKAVSKLTTGPRAILFFIDRYADTMATSRKRLAGLIHWAFRIPYRSLRGGVHRLADRCLDDCRIVSSDLPGPVHAFHIALVVSAFRPID